MANQRHYCWTLWLESEDGSWKLKPEDWMPDVEHRLHRYTVCQVERSKEGRLHWQGYTEFKDAMSLQMFKEWFGWQHVHLADRKGTRDNARIYCMKEKSRINGWGPFEFGKWIKGQGNRSDLDKIAEEIKEKGLDGAIDYMPGAYIKFSNGMEKLARHYSKNKKRIVSTTYGEYEDGMYCVQFINGELSFKGYSGEETIFLSDGISRPELERGLPFWAGDTWARWTKIVIQE